MENVVIVKLGSLPNSLFHDWLVDVSILVGDELSLTMLLFVHAEVRAHEELALEQLDADDTKHEDEEDGDGHDVTDGLDGHDHTLDNLLESRSSVDGSQGSQDTEDTKNLEETDS